MHSRNPYRKSPDFAALADAYPALKPHVFVSSDGTATIDFKDISSQRCLTAALLFHDFGLCLTTRDDRLCPPVPNRLNYVLWMQDIIHASRLNASADATEPVEGIDIGTGATAIYPLLACKLEPHWRFVATDIDAESLTIAQLNITTNGLSERIRLARGQVEGNILFPVTLFPDTKFDITICNPPFYSSREDVERSAEGKSGGPSSVCTGAEHEMITPGGETVFVSRIIEESKVYTTRCRWYTSMLGKLSSLSSIVALLRQHSIDNYAITEFVQGQTRRWAIGWSFTDVRLPDSIARISNPALQNIMPARNTLRQPFLCASTQRLRTALDIVLASIEGVLVSTLPITVAHESDTESEDSVTSLLITAAGNTWSRNARRKRQAAGSTLTESEASTAHSSSLECRIDVRCSKSKSSDETDSRDRNEGKVEVEYNWARGRDRALFESFCSHVSRKVGLVLEKG